MHRSLILSSVRATSNAKRESVRTANPNIAFGDVAKKISTLWKECAESEKKTYETAAVEDKVCSTDCFEMI